MLRHAVFTSLLFCSSIAAARIGPEIAYSTATQVYLVNLDGSGKVQLYRSRSNNYINSVALKPGGGTIAFVENGTLKFIDYNSSGTAVWTTHTIIPNCYRLADVHFAPDGGSVIYRELCANQNTPIKRVAVPTLTTPNPSPTTIASIVENVQDLGPMDQSGSSFIYTDYTGTNVELRRHNLNGADSASPIAATSSPSAQLRYPDISGDGSKILISDSPLDASAYPGTGYTSEIDAVSGASIRSNFVLGRKGNYAPDGVQVVFIAAYSYNEKYIRYIDRDGLPHQIGGSGIYTAVDWGN